MHLNDLEEIVVGMIRSNDDTVDHVASSQVVFLDLNLTFPLER